MRRTILVGLLLATVQSTPPAFAHWVAVGKTDQAVTYVEPTAVGTFGKLREVWVLRDFESAQHEHGGPFRSSVGHYEVDCSQRQLRQVFHTTHAGPMGGGGTVGAERVRQPFAPAVPGSSGDMITQAVCR
jgi:hypothetical protein